MVTEIDLKKSIDLIKEFEGLRLKAYLDGGGVPTIGYGTTRYSTGKKVKISDEITEENAYLELKLHCEKVKNNLKEYLIPWLNTNQFCALVSLVYNIGTGSFGKSTMLKLININEFDAAAKEFDRWIYDNGKKIDGLIRRRAAEKGLFTEP